jgi:CMP-N-acetylneuraminic acid synthetase
MTEIVALVPMRHHSQRVPGKNVRPLAGKPLFHHILTSLMECSEIARVAVDTDSETVMAGLRQHFPDVMIIERPENLRADTISMNDILLHDMTQIKAEVYLQTHSTNPLLRPATISRAIRTFQSNYPAYDSLFSVTRVQRRLWDRDGHPINHDPNFLLQTQDLPPIYEENSCLYLFTRANLLKRKNRLGEHPWLFEIDAVEAWDIDEEFDFTIADLLLSRQR